MIKVILFGANTPENRINIAQRNGKKIALAVSLELDVISERLEDLNSQAAVNFSITEIPLDVAKKVIADTAEGQPAIVVMEYGKPVKDAVKDKVADWVAKCVRQVPLLHSQED
ncbi:hypothetical protein [Neorhizobium sp. NCHU2750]|uniref:hypothetical protein n=1 Tax=Neorhizobium sp. NCHU2750 TaxID=1825976 RepID=UPI000EB6E114|nr:hypothetical protein NCHU2750_23740 [Neorhizobium sp. NCHU2750]